MGGYRRWRDSGHLERAVKTAGGDRQFEDEVRQQRKEAQGWRLAEIADTGAGSRPDEH